MASNSLFDERRAAQAAAYLLFRAGGNLPLIKLVKLLYLAERLSLQRYAIPLTGDNLVSMPHGPVLSCTYDHMIGAVPSTDGGWDSLISDRSGHMVALQRPVTPDELLRLSDSDIEVLEETWDKFGLWDRWELVRYTHSDACPEWEDPEGSSRPIKHQTLLLKLGYSPEHAQALSDQFAGQRALNRILN